MGRLVTGHALMGWSWDRKMSRLEAASTLEVSPSRFDRMRSAGLVESRIGGKGTRVYSAEQIEALAAERLPVLSAAAQARARQRAYCALQRRFSTFFAEFYAAELRKERAREMEKAPPDAPGDAVRTSASPAPRKGQR